MTNHIAMRFALGAIIAGALALVSAGAAAQQPPVAQLVVGGVQVDGGSAAASVTVLDASGNPVGGLAQGAFSVQVDGQPVALASATSELNNALPLGVILTIDTSGSMADGGRLEAAKAAVRPLVDALQPDDRMALVIFANGVQTLLQPTADKAELSRYISGLTPVGNTALYAATSQSAALAQGLSQPRKVVVLLSDGEEFGNFSGGITREQALATAAASNVPFFVVGLGQVDLPYLTQLAQPAGGQLFTTANAADLAALYDRIAQRLRVQYTLRFAMPQNLAPGDHRVTVSAGGKSAESTFQVAGQASSPSSVAFQGLGAELREKTRVTLTNLPSNARVAWQVDGQQLNPATADGHAVDLDPYTFPAGGSHTLVAVYDPSNPESRVTTSFRVPALPPLITSPTELPNLEPGDLVILEVSAQPGVAVTAIYRIDGADVERDMAPPYEFELPRDGFEEGDHALAVVLEGAGERSEKTYAFEGPAGSSTNYGAYGIIALAALAVLAGIGYGGRLAFERYRDRSRPVDLSGVAPALREWARDRRGDGEDEGPRPAAVPSAPPPPGAWGSFVVVESASRGDKVGTRWALKDETELVGRGKFCSVRLKDRAIEDAHFVITREAELHASTPTCRVEVGGEIVRRATLADGATIKLGGTTLRFEATTP